jgi:NAD(P)-dependent dehydrogenase (short-subunit alcohol dehydrogenase family)
VPELSLNGRIAVVTGANSGVGRSATELLRAAGAAVTLVCRNRARGERVLAEMATASHSAQATLEIADLASLDSVRALANRLSLRLPRIDILVNNAGVWRTKLELTADGFERTFATNHLGHFVLTTLLLPRMRGGHIVNVSSEAHRRGNLRRVGLEQMARGEAWRAGGFPAYADSKLANVLFTVEAARRWREYDVTANAVHPGVLATGLWDQNRGALAAFVRPFSTFMRSPTVGGSAVLNVIDLALREVATGRYFRVSKESEPQPQVTDTALAQALWENSIAWGNLA